MTQPPPSASFRAPAPVFTLDNAQRQVLTRKLATLLLRPLATNPYRTIVLSGCSFGDAAVNVAGPLLLTLARKQCLHTVILSDVLASLCADEALRSLSSLASSIGTYKRLVAVDLSHNAIGTRGMAACAPLLQSQPLLQVVNLEDTGMSVDAARLLREYMLSSSTSSGSASSTSSSPSSSSTVATTTPTSPSSRTTSLQGFNVHGNRLESDGLVHIAAIVERSPQLHCLRTSSVGADAFAVTTLARALLNAPDLRELDISDNSCNEETATALAAALARQPRLARLVLSDMNMGDASLSIIVDALMASRAPIAELRLSGNELSTEAAHDVARLIKADHSRLAILDVSSNVLGDEGIRIIAEAATSSQARIPLAKLFIADNEASSVAVINLASKFVRSPGLALLDFSQNEDVPSSVSKRIAAVFPPTVVVLEEDDDDDDNEAERTDADTEVEEPLDEDDDGPNRRRMNSASQIEMALQALEAAVRDERGGIEISSPRSQPDVSRLVQFFSSANQEASKNNSTTTTSNSRPDLPSTNDESTNTQSEIINREEIEMEPASTRGSDEGEGVPGTPPPSRFLGGITSPITPPPSSSTLRDSGKDSTRGDEATDTRTTEEPEDEEEGNVILSARKLKESIVSLSKEISDVAGELEMPVTPPLESGNSTTRETDADEEDASRILLIGKESDTADSTKESTKPETSPPSTVPSSSTSFVSFAVDCVGGCFIALFVVVIVLAIAKSQEETTFSFRPL